MTARKPLRSYRASLSPKGETIELLLDCDRPTLEALMRKGAIEEAEVLRLGRKHRIALSASDARALAWAVNVMRATSPAKRFLGDGAQGPFDAAFFERLIDNIVDVQRDLSKLVDADRSGDHLIRRKDRDGRDVAVIEIDEIDSRRLARCRHELTATGEHLGRYAPRTFHRETWHGDVAYLVHLLKRAAETKDKKPSFSNPDAGGVGFVETALIRAGVLSASDGEMNRQNIVAALRRLRLKKKTILQDIPNG
jgi:hypothetical protein